MADRSILRQWTVEDSIELYGVRNWGADWFGVSADGESTVSLSRDGHTRVLSLYELVQGLKQRGMALPLLLRFGDLLDASIANINRCFHFS